MDFYEFIGFYGNVVEPAGEVPELPDLGDAAVFLDFDGTLVDIAETPDGVEVAPDLETILDGLNRRTDGRTVIVSGRSVDIIAKLLPTFDGIIVGSHGAEHRGGELADPPRHAREGLGCMRAVMAAYAGHHDGVLLEERPYSVVLHFRQAPEFQQQIEALLDALVKEWDNLVLHRAKMALEVMPSQISKATAVERLHEAWAGSVPVAIGDDRTDEGMLRYAVGRGGVAIKVGPGHTDACCRLDRPDEVHALLRNWLSQQEKPI